MRTTLIAIVLLIIASGLAFSAEPNPFIAAVENQEGVLFVSFVAGGSLTLHGVTRLSFRDCLSYTAQNAYCNLRLEFGITYAIPHSAIKYMSWTPGGDMPDLVLEQLATVANAKRIGVQDAMRDALTEYIANNKPASP